MYWSSNNGTKCFDSPFHLQYVVVVVVVVCIGICRINETFSVIITVALFAFSLRDESADRINKMRSRSDSVIIML